MDKIKEVQFGTSITGDLYESTWTFEMPKGFELSAGEFAIIPIEVYKELKK